MGLLAKILGIIDSCKSYVTITGHGSQVGGIVGISEAGSITNCINYSPINGEVYSGGICGYAENTVFDSCGNHYDATITSTSGYTGGIIGYLCSQNEEYNFAVQKCYNYGSISSSIATGGIVGGAWNEDGQLLIIQNSYNMGEIVCDNSTNGGILGGTYNLYDSNYTRTDKILVYTCYNLGTITSSSPNQISSLYANVQNCYYLHGSPNSSDYGMSKFENNFKSVTKGSSVGKNLNMIFPETWVVNEHNSGYISLAWQNE